MVKREIATSMLVVLITACAAGSSVATGLIVWSMMKPEEPAPDALPTTEAPDLALTIVDGITGKDVEVPLLEIVAMMANPNKLKSVQEEIGGKTRTILGVNPIDLFDEYGFWDPWNITVMAGDATSNVINVSDMYISDSEFFGDAVGDPIIIGVACDNMWLGDSPINDIANYGNFSVFGSTRESAQKIRDVVALNITSHWQVEVFVDNVSEYIVNRSNIMDNEITDQFDYYDNDSGKGWNRTYSGRTISDIVNQTSALGQDYNITIIAADGWGSKWVYNNTDINKGLTEEKQAMINDPEEPLDPEGKLMALYYEAADIGEFHTLNNVGSGGPFKTVVPGQTRNRYMKLVTEIRVVLI